MRFINCATFVDDQRKLGDLQPEHASYLASLLAEGKLAAVGSFADGTGELQVYETRRRRLVPWLRPIRWPQVALWLAAN